SSTGEMRCSDIEGSELPKMFHSQSSSQVITYAAHERLLSDNLNFMSSFTQKKTRAIMLWFFGLKKNQLIQLFFNTCSFTSEATQVVKFRLTNITATLDRNTVYLTAVGLERTLYPNTVRNFAHSE